MKVQMVVEHIQSGKKWFCPPGEDCTAKEFEQEKRMLYENIKEINALEVDNIIIPGDFIRNHCVIHFIVNATD